MRRLAPDTPEEFELIIAQLLEKDPAKRIATALAVANRLKAMEYGLSAGNAARTSMPSTSRWPADEEYKLAGEADDQPTVIARGETRFVAPAEQELMNEPDSHRTPSQPDGGHVGLVPPGRAEPARAVPSRGRRANDQHAFHNV